MWGQPPHSPGTGEPEGEGDVPDEEAGACWACHRDDTSSLGCRELTAFPVPQDSDPAGIRACVGNHVIIATALPRRAYFLRCLPEAQRDKGMIRGLPGRKRSSPRQGNAKAVSLVLQPDCLGPKPYSPDTH